MLCIGVKDVLKNLNVTNGTESGDCSIEEKMVDGRRWARATTPRKLRELQVIGNKRRRIINDIIVHKNIIGQRQTREMDVEGVDAKDNVRGKKIKKTVIIIGGPQMSAMRRGDSLETESPSTVSTIGGQIMDLRRDLRQDLRQD